MRFKLISLLAVCQLILCQCGKTEETQTRYKTEQVQKYQEVQTSETQNESQESLKELIESGEIKSSGDSQYCKKYETIMYDIDGNKFSDVLYEVDIDESGNVLSQIQHNMLLGYEVQQETYNTYDKSGNLIKSETVASDGYVTIFEYTFDEYNNPLEVKLNNEVQEIHEYKYDDQNRILEDKVNSIYGNSDEASWTYTTFYDYGERQDNKPITKTVYYVANDVEEVHTFDYSKLESDEYYTETVTTNSDDNVIVYKLDTAGKTLRYKDNTTEIVSEYDDRGNLVKAVVSNEYTDDSGVQTLTITEDIYEYEYDDLDRMIKSQSYSNGSLTSEQYFIY